MRLYGLNWKEDADLAQVEMKMIQRGGHEGNLAQHYLTLRKLIWPDRLTCSWTPLIYQEILQNQMTILMGCASSWKTSTASEFVLLDYWCFPQITAVLVSTTTREKAEDAVWAEIKMLFQKGKKARPWLAGNILDYRQAILTEDLEKDGIRDLRKGLKVKACFPNGSMVDTPTGKIPIEKLKVGDCVINADGVGKVKSTHARISKQLIRIRLYDGRYIDCTEEHPFFTQRGWIKAIDLTTYDRVFSANETMRLLRRPARAGIPKSETLLSVLPKLSPEEKMRAMRPFFSSSQSSNCNYGKNRKILQPSMFRSVGREEKTSTSEKNKCVQTLWEKDGCGSFSAQVLLCKMSRPPRTSSLCLVWKGLHFGAASTTSKESFLQSVLHSELDEISGRSQGASTSNSTGIDGMEMLPEIPMELLHKNGTKENRRASTLVQAGYSFSRDKIGGGNRRRYSLETSVEQKSRQETDKNSKFSWVESVEILKPEGDPRFNKGEGGYRVHNIEVSGHPSYSVNGVIVHNCYVGQSYVGLGVFAGIKQQRVRFLADELQYMPATFLDCLPNMFSNPDVKVIGSGNPNHDPDTQLAISAEPKDGWAVVEHIEETTVWDTAFHQSRCVNLIGTDSDNFKSDPTKPEPFPRLIGPRYAKKIAHDYGENSPEMETQVRGRMKLSLASARVITRLICKEHHAHDKAVWSGKPLMKIHACDPAFGGGDRCVSGHIEIGEDVQGKTVVRVPMPHTIKIDLRLPKSAEIQIVEAVKRELDAEGIPAKNSFYDSFGKGTIGFSYSTIFGSDCPVPVDSGGKCTKRPVRQDFFVDEQDNRGRVTRRLKRCDEHYSKFVTEMWFTVRYVIEAEQMRELPMAIVEEGCQREYGDVEGGKIEVEPKDQMRLRKNKSPDLFDWLAIAIEGARRLGFVVDRLGNEEDDGDPKWLEDLRERQKTLRKDWVLNTSF